jgi:beta-glucanase (GH16 family)
MLQTSYRLKFAILLMTSTIAAAQNATQPPSRAGWTLTWSDEFNAPDGSPIDNTKWILETGGNGWGNQELEYYTTRSENSFQQGGNLVIKALQEKYAGADGVTRDYTSARLKTAGKFSQKHGRFEARIKIPRGQGIWPAFWMLGDDIDKIGWPKCGEIDIMENIGREPSIVHGTLHAPGYPPEGYTAAYTLPNGQAFSDSFHLYAVEWEPRQIRIYVDGNLYATDTQAGSPAPNSWPFGRQPFFLLLNLAVGGNWPGNPDATTQFPQPMLVDYVRVYQKK